MRYAGGVIPESGGPDPPLRGEMASRSDDGGMSAYRDPGTPPTGVAGHLPLQAIQSGFRPLCTIATEPILAFGQERERSGALSP